MMSLPLPMTCYYGRSTDTSSKGSCSVSTDRLYSKDTWHVRVLALGVGACSKNRPDKTGGGWNMGPHWRRRSPLQLFTCLLHLICACTCYHIHMRIKPIGTFALLTRPRLLQFIPVWCHLSVVLTSNLNNFTVASNFDWVLVLLS